MSQLQKSLQSQKDQVSDLYSSRNNSSKNIMQTLFSFNKKHTIVQQLAQMAQSHPIGCTQSLNYEKYSKQQINIEDDLKSQIKSVDQTVLKNKKSYSKQYIPLGSIVDHTVLKKHQLLKLNFQNIYLNNNNQNSLNRIVLKHNDTSKQMRFYLPTFIRFSLIKLHSQDLKNITHIQNKNNMIIYINVYTKGLPKMLIDKLTKKSKDGENNQQPKLLFRANRKLFQAKYYATYNNYLIFMFNAFSQDMTQFQIMKSIMYAPFQQASLILHIRINKKVFKLQTTKTLKISKSDQNSHNQLFQTMLFNKIILEFKLEKPKNIVDSFKFHKSIEFGNYGIMTNQININIGTYQSPEKKEKIQEEKSVLGINQDLLHETQLQDISSLRLSIGLYKHPVTELCTFFIPTMLLGGLTLLLFHLCDHNLTNQLQVLAIILVAYGAFIPEFRQRISMSRTVIILDFYILFNMIPAILCAVQSVHQMRGKGTYNLYEIVSVIIYYISVIFLIMVYLMYIYIDKNFYKKNVQNMVSNFDTSIFDQMNFQQDIKQCLSWFVLPDQNQKAFFLQKQSPQQKIRKNRRGFRSQTLLIPSSAAQQQSLERGLQASMALVIKMSKTMRNGFKQAKQFDEQQQQKPEPQNKQNLYKIKAIQNQRHIHTFQKVFGFKGVIIMIAIIIAIIGVTVLISWNLIISTYMFEDANRNCVHDDDEEKQLKRAEEIIKKEQKLQTMIQEAFSNQQQLYKINHQHLKSTHNQLTAKNHLKSTKNFSIQNQKKYSQEQLQRNLKQLNQLFKKQKISTQQQTRQKTKFNFRRQYQNHAKN